MFTHRDELFITGPDDRVGDLKSIEDCDRAIAALSEIIANIEGRLEAENSDPEWRRKAKRALSLKKSARNEVYSKRKDFKMEFWKTWEGSFVTMVKKLSPELFHVAVALTDEAMGMSRDIRKAA